MLIYVKQVESMRWLVRRTLSVVAVAAIATAFGMVVALGAYASGHHKHRLAVFSHPLTRRGHAKYADARNLPAGSVLAEMFGTAEVYVSEDPGTTCLMVIESTSEGGSCGRTDELLKEGMITVHVAFGGQVRVGVLMPNGVSNVTLTDHDGASHQLKVANNVAEMYDAKVASVRYTLPDGSTRTERIPAAAVSPSP
jgi:hypothetical protein